MVIDTTAWTSNRRLRESVVNMAKVLASFTATNAIVFGYNGSWIMMSINILGFITGILPIISHSRFNKLPPQEEIK